MTLRDKDCRCDIRNALNVEPLLRIKRSENGKALYTMLHDAMECNTLRKQKKTLKPSKMI